MNILKKINEMNIIFDQVRNSSDLFTSDDANKVFGSIAVMSEINAAFSYWRMCGSKIFVLSETLVEAFKNTDIPMKMNSGDFHYPFDAFIVESNKTPLFTTMYGKHAAPVYTLLYVYAQKAADEAGFPVLDLSKGTLSNDTDIRHDRELFGFLPAVKTENNPDPTGVERLKLNLVDSVSFHEISKLKTNNPIDIACDSDDMSNLVNIFYNTIMYINDPTRSVVESEERRSRSISDGIKKGSVRQEYILLKAPKSYKSEADYAKGTGLTVRFPVRGHWREQSYGEKHSLRRHQWIHPFWKGPEMSEVVSKPYRLD
jgi:hypothetical protein